MAATDQLMDVFAKRALPPLSTRRSFLGSGTQEKCVGCKETQAKLESCQNFSVQLKNKLLEGKKDLELVKRKHTEINNDIIRGNVRLQSRYPFTPSCSLHNAFFRLQFVFAFTLALCTNFKQE